MSRIEGILAKVERAKKHIHELEVEIGSFLDGKPYRVSVKAHSQLSFATCFYMEHAEPIPTVIPIVTGDVIQNLRSALDHLAWQLVEASGSPPGKGTAFPIFDHAVLGSEKEIAKFVARKVKGMKEPMRDAISGLHPYKGGNDYLWAIHDINITDKHSLLVTSDTQLPNSKFEAGPSMPCSRLPVGIR
jgi:hypothetical protein